MATSTQAAGGVDYARQWLRGSELLIGNDQGLDLSDFHFTFEIKHTDSSKPSTAKIRIYNLGEAAISRIRREYNVVMLRAGYQGNLGTIFHGTLIEASSGTEGQTNPYLDIVAADGDLPYNFATMSQTLQKGATVHDRVQAVLAAMKPMGVTAGYMAELPPGATLRANVNAGMCRDVLDDLCRTAGCIWRIHDNRLEIVPEKSYVRETVQILTDQTGVIGRPAQIDKGIKVKMLLNPAIKPGRLVYLNNDSIKRYRYQTEAEQARLKKEKAAKGNGAKPAQPEPDLSTQRKLADNGYYYVMVAEHNGDTRKTDWFTTITCLAWDATLEPPGELSGQLQPAPKEAS
jgi:hypothetical protein